MSDLPEPRQASRDVSWSVMFRLARTGVWVEWSNGHRDPAEAIQSAEVLAPMPSVAQIRFDRVTRAREMVDYKTFRDMMSENATDYVPSSKATGLHFAVMQNKLYRHLTGMTAEQIKATRPLQTWPGCEEGKPEPSAKNAARKVAKNYLTSAELTKLDRLVGRLCLRAEDITDDGLHLSLAQWDYVVDMELATSRHQLAA